MTSHDRGRWRIETQLDDTRVLYRIADDSAGTMFQIPGFVHLLAACLYRLRDANFELLQELGVSSIGAAPTGISAPPTGWRARPGYISPAQRGIEFAFLQCHQGFNGSSRSYKGGMRAGILN